jgi:enoyl-CoA hydratase/carnithine racemase
MEFKDTLFEIKKGIAVLTLNMPDTRNAITGERVINELEAVSQLINGDKSVQVLIITGNGPAFSSGGNIKDMASKSGMFSGAVSELRENYRNYVQKIPRLMQAIEVPVIAAVNGAAIGAGFDLTLMCDIRIASVRAKFGETFLNVGLIPGDGGAWFLPRIVGLARACELTFTGDVIEAEEALALGLVSYVVEHRDLMKKAMEMAGKIASKPPGALRMSKKLIQMSQRLSLDDLLEQSASMQSLCHNTKDHIEALTAMFEKRNPIFKGE